MLHFSSVNKDCFQWIIIIIIIQKKMQIIPYVFLVGVRGNVL